MFRKISVFSKKIAVAAAIALAMTSLSACGDSGKKDSASERTTHTISNINTDSTTELSTAATNDTSDDKTTASEQSSDTVTEATTEKTSDDVVIAATQRLADVYNTGDPTGLLDDIPDGLIDEVLGLIKQRVNNGFLADGDITDAATFKSWISYYLSSTQENDEYKYTAEITGDAKEIIIDEVVSYLAEKTLGDDVFSEFILGYIKGATKLYSIPLKISISEIQEDGIIDHGSQDMTDIVFMLNGEAYSLGVILAVVPAVVRFIDKSAKVEDKMMADTIRVAVEVALANEDAFTDVDNALKAAPKDAFITAKDKDGNDKQYLIVASISKDGVFEMRNGVPADGAFNTEIKLSITKVIVKFIAYGADRFTVAVDEEYRPAVFIGTADNEIKWQMTPETDPEYQ